MLKGNVLHPHILSALGKAGHGSKVLISDGNYPHWTKRGINAEVVYLNLAPGLVGAVDVLRVIAGAIPIEAADVMDYTRTGPYALPAEPPIWNDYRTVLAENRIDATLNPIEKFRFYEVAGTQDVCLTIATGEERIFANLLLTIGVVKRAD